MTENIEKALKSEIDESTKEIDRLLRRIKDLKELTEDARLGRLAVESEKDELLSVEDTAKFLKSFGE